MRHDPPAYAILTIATARPGLTADELGEATGLGYAVVMHEGGPLVRCGFVALDDAGGWVVTDAGRVAMAHLGYVPRPLGVLREHESDAEALHRHELSEIERRIADAQREAELEVARREASATIRRIRAAAKPRQTGAAKQGRPEGWPWKGKRT